MSEHTHTTLVSGCFRCDLNRDEMNLYRSDERVTYDAEDIVYLNKTDGLRVSPRGVIHRADCRTQDRYLRPVVLPYPKYADDEDRPCKVCRPVLDGAS